MPGRTILFHVSRREISALVLAMWINFGSKPAAPTIFCASSKRRSCSETEGASIISEDAKWVERPSRSRCGDALRTFRTAESSSSATPRRPIPVSTFKCTGCRWVARAAAFSRDSMCHGSHTVGVSWSRTISLSSPRQKPVINKMRDSMPASRSGIASSSEVTPSQRAPSSRNAREHSTAPCPYASAFTTAHTVTSGPAFFTTVRKFCCNVVRETSAHVGRVATRLGISMVVATEVDYSGSGARPQVTLGLLPSDVLPSPAQISRRSVSSQREVHGDLSFYFDGLIVQNVRPVVPLAHGIDSSRHEHRMAGQDDEIFNRTLLADHCLQHDGPLNTGAAR